MNIDQQKTLRALHRQRRRIIRRLVIVGVIIVILFLWLWPKYVAPDGISPKTQLQSGASSATGGAQLEKGNPDFTTLTPDDKSGDEFGGWTRVSPPNSDPVYAYIDKISGVFVIVSEQELPEDFRSNPDERVEEFAQSISANRSIEASDGTEIFIGTSAKGPQSVALHKNDLLILIKSDTALNDEQWTSYVDSLR